MIQKRKKAQFNLIDVLIVIFILALIAMAAYWIFGGFRDAKAPAAETITFDVRISGVREDALPFITEGLAVKNSVTGEPIGTIVSVRTEKSRHYGGVYRDENGVYMLGVSESPDEYDVYVTVSVSITVEIVDYFYCTLFFGKRKVYGVTILVIIERLAVFVRNGNRCNAYLRSLCNIKD